MDKQSGCNPGSHVIGATCEVDYPYFPFRLPVDYVLVSKTDDLSRQYHRTLFEKAARKEGLIINYEYAGPICFTLISTPFQRLCREAEKLQLSFPLKDCPINPAAPACCITLSSAFIADDTVDYISAPFTRRQGELFLNYSNERLFFTSAQRCELTHEILTQIDISQQLEKTMQHDSAMDVESQKSVIADEPLKRKGLQYLLMEKTYDDSFILHEPSQEEPYFRKMKENSFVNYVELMNEIEKDPRKKLGGLWARLFRFQPLGLVREYFGEQIAFYFAWQGTFLTMLWPATIFGLAVFIFGFLKSVRTNPATYGNCTVINYSGDSAIVPCSIRSQVAQLFTTVSSWFMKSFDNELNAFFAAFMSIWGTMFYQIWRRNNAVLAYEWDCENFSAVEPDRPEYQGSAMRTDPITEQPEYFSPVAIRIFKYTVSCIAVVLSMCLVILSVFLVTLYKLWAITSNECQKEYTFQCSIVAAYIPSIMNTVSTMVLGSIYETLVLKLTQWENHRTDSEYHNALVIKMFALQIVNNYTSLFYVAFIRPENNGFQANGLFGFGERFKDVCVPGTCGSLLALQLISHMIIKPLPKFTKDIVIPYFVHAVKLRKWSSARRQTLQDVLNESDETNVLVREWIKPSARDFSQGEFNEKIIMFGSTMMFAALFPLAPLLALVIGVIDLRIDALRLLWLNRRPIPVMASGIGIWLPILYFLQYAAVMTNAFIIAFTSDFCSNFFSDVMYCDVKNRFLIVIVFQNMVFILKYVFQSIIPAVPASIRVAQRRKRYVVNYITEKGDVPYRIKNRRRARNAKLAWVMSLAKGGMSSRLIPKVGVEQSDHEAHPSSQPIPVVPAVHHSNK
ncbi:Anoctamin [Trichostrongylus colubriformis]|uniref:Anoctamin n=1 Tax=Trichostrongylus colubriformis TaxID=6319 RepID=A0AAN8G920_TRICO